MNRGEFTVKNDSKYINSLRRVLMYQVPTVAIDTVFIYENSSYIHDEMLAQRLGAVPLNVDPASVGDDEEIELTLEVETGEKSRDVLSGDLVSETIKPFLDDIVLSHMGPNQKIKLTAKARKGIGETHAKWSPITAFLRRGSDQVFIETTGLPVQQVWDTCMAITSS